MANLKFKNGKIITGTEGIAFNDSANVASGADSHAEGFNTSANGFYSHAEGGGTTASGNVSHAEGFATTASGDDSHAQGNTTVASGNYSDASGLYSRAIGPASFAGGYGTASFYNEAGGTASFVYGYLQNRAYDTGTAIIGGTSNDVGLNATYTNDYAVIVGGNNNTIDSTSANDSNSVIIGGTTNTITNCTNSVIIGGTTNTLTGEDNTILLGGIKRGGYVLANTLTAANTNSSNTAYNTVWTFNAVAGAIYKMEMIGNYQTAALTTGIKIKLGGTATCDVVGKLYGAVSNAAVATELAIPATSMTSELITTGVAVINAPHFVGADVVFRCTVAGTVLVTMASEVNTSAAQLNIGSTCVVERIN